MQEALENLALAGDYKEAESVRARYIALAARTNPFSRPSISIPTNQESMSAGVPTSASSLGSVELPEQLVKQIDELIEFHNSRLIQKADSFDPRYVMRSIDSAGGSKLSEKSIAS
jgi:hypothetical protein